MSKPDYETPLSRAQHLGSAHSGTGHLRQMHLTSLAAIPLTAAFVYIAAHYLGASYAEAREAFTDPLVAGAVALFVAVSAHHMRIGMISIILDYVHGEKLKPLLLTVNNFFCGLAAFLSLLALLQLYLGA